MKVIDILRESAGPSKEFLDCLKVYINNIWHDLDPAAQARIDKAFQAEMPALGEEMTLFRGMSLESLDDLPAHSNFTERDRITFDGYLSASHNMEIAAEHSRLHGGAQIMFIIEAGPPARGIAVDDYGIRSADAENEYGVFEPDEQEVVLDRTIAYDVLDADDLEGDGTAWEVHLRAAA